jgi:hypothetical protein
MVKIDLAICEFSKIATFGLFRQSQQKSKPLVNPSNRGLMLAFGGWESLKKEQNFLQTGVKAGVMNSKHEKSKK